MRAGERAVLVANLSLFLFAAILFFFLPESIVCHWGFDGPDRFGGRYHILFLPLLSCILSFVSLSVSWIYERREPVKGEALRHLMLYTCVVIVTVCMLGVLMITAYNI